MLFIINKKDKYKVYIQQDGEQGPIYNSYAYSLIVLGIYMVMISAFKNNIYMKFSKNLNQANFKKALVRWVQQVRGISTTRGEIMVLVNRKGIIREQAFKRRHYGSYSCVHPFVPSR